MCSSILSEVYRPITKQYWCMVNGQLQQNPPKDFIWSAECHLNTQTWWYTFSKVYCSPLLNCSIDRRQWQAKLIFFLYCLHCPSHGVASVLRLRSFPPEEEMPFSWLSKHSCWSYSPLMCIACQTVIVRSELATTLYVVQQQWPQQPRIQIGKDCQRLAGLSWSYYRDNLKQLTENVVQQDAIFNSSLMFWIILLLTRRHYWVKSREIHFHSSWNVGYHKTTPKNK